MTDPNLQTQPNGVEMTLKQVERLTGAGTVDYDNYKQISPTLSRYILQDKQK